MKMIRNKKEIEKFLKYDRSLKSAYTWLKKNLIGYEIVIKKHSSVEKGVKKLIGYIPSGEWQIFITKDKKQWSLIKCMASFGLFEIMMVKPRENEPHRFRGLRELINHIEKQYGNERGN